MTICGSARLLGLALVLMAGPASAVGLTLSEPVPGAGDSIVFTVGLDAPTSINGYDVTLFWDSSELSFLSATELSGLGFDTAPAGATPAGERVATFELTPVLASDLFAVRFSLLPGAAFDGSPDVGVFVGAANGTGLIPGVIDNPLGVGFDVVPEPGSGLLLAAGLLVLARRRRGIRG
jgi:hypothetical protein